MITHLEILPGLPGDKEVVQYSNSGRGSFREGVVAKLTDEHGHAWIGNFQSAGSAGHHLFANGLAALCAGPNCYLITDRDIRPKIIHSHCDHSTWAALKTFEQKGKSYLLVAGSCGYLACIDDAGSEVASTHISDPCEDVRVEAVQADRVRGSYYEFNRKERLLFEFSLPSLSEK